MSLFEILLPLGLRDPTDSTCNSVTWEFSASNCADASSCGEGTPAPHCLGPGVASLILTAREEDLGMQCKPNFKEPEKDVFQHS